MNTINFKDLKPGTKYNDDTMKDHYYLECLSKSEEVINVGWNTYAKMATFKRIYSAKRIEPSIIELPFKETSDKEFTRWYMSIKK